LRSRTSKAIALCLVSLIPRLFGAFFLPNAFGDAYVYIQEIGTLSTKISSGSFRITDLFGFWLPFYQLIAALLNVVVKNGFYSGKIVAAVFGAGTCFFVYLVTQHLTKNETAALWMWLLIAFNPLHVFYSGSAMTDVPHAFLVIGTLYFALTGNWIVAAIFGALAGFTRVESWMLIALLPFLQFTRERRISAVAVLILIVPPLLWFYISWKATGNWLACFVQRQEYHDWLLRMNPAIAHFSLISLSKDLATLLISSDIAVLLASFAAGWFVLGRARELIASVRSDNGNVLPPVLFYLAFFVLLFVAYLTHQQPVIFPRYGLILFTLGLPILAWTFLRIRHHRPQTARVLLIVVVAFCVFDAGIQLAGAVGTVRQYRAQRAVADYLRDHFNSKSAARIFCDEGTVRVLSGIPESRFLTSSQARGDDTAFESFLQTSQVEYLVIADVQGSRLAKLSRSGETPTFDGFEPVFHSHAVFLPTDIWLLAVSEARGSGRATSASGPP
jgi:hypothetical protein